MKIKKLKKQKIGKGIFGDIIDGITYIPKKAY